MLRRGGYFTSCKCILLTLLFLLILERNGMITSNTKNNTTSRDAQSPRDRLNQLFERIKKAQADEVDEVLPLKQAKRKWK